MKLCIKISIFTLTLAGVCLLILPAQVFPSFYDIRYMGIASLLGALTIYGLPRFLQVKESTPNATQKNKAVDLFQLLLAFIIFSNALGDLGLYQLYKVGFEFDKFIHFLNPFLVALLLPTILQERFEIRKSYSIALACFVVCIGGVAWELFEYAADQILETHIYGVYGSDISHDTKFDIVFDLMGGLVGIIVYNFFSKRGLAK